MIEHNEDDTMPFAGLVLLWLLIGAIVLGLAVLAMFLLEGLARLIGLA